MKTIARCSIILMCLFSAPGAPHSFAAPASYQEPFRPQFHFTPATNWMNDPNGMVFYEGEYHLFYQYNPFGDKWGHMSWGHAVSPDLVHWQHLPVALYEENDIMIFSGSAVVDWKNSSGLGREGKPPLVAIYTGHYTKKPLQNQHIAYSNDRGRTWTKYAGNPVLDIGEKDFRDPKVIWHPPTRRWIMTVAWPTHRQVRFYASPNLKEWTHLSDFGPAGSTQGIWECPDLFPLPSKGASAWVLIVNVGSGAPAGGSGTQYFVGQFDGTRFVLDPSFPKQLAEFVPAGKTLADFEGDNYGDWQATGEAFGPGPARGKIGGQQNVDGFRGRGLVNTFLTGDSAQGTLTSPDFIISHDHINFLVGGGNHAGKTCLNLLIGDRVVRTATGDAAERLAWKSWKVRDLRGERARIQIVDRETGGWGHINVDHILLADTAARPATEPALWADFGPDFYAGVSWSDVPKRDGRRLWLGWMSNWQYANDVPTAPWRSAMSIARELSLGQIDGQWQLVQTPVKEMKTLRRAQKQLAFRKLTGSADLSPVRALAAGLFEVVADLKPAQDAVLELTLRQGGTERTTLLIDVPQRRMTLDRRNSGKADFHGRFSGEYSAPIRLVNGRLQLHLLVDTSSVEVFANHGETVLTTLIFPSPGANAVDFNVRQGELNRGQLTFYSLRSAWQ
jgi:fructan beta-fructosidase